VVMWPPGVGFAPRDGLAIALGGGECEMSAKIECVWSVST